MAGNDSYTKSLLHMNGADASITFTDSAISGTHSWTASGNAQLDTAQSKFGGACGLFDGTEDYIFTLDSADWDFGTGNWTIDFWVRFNSLADSTFFSQYVDGNNDIVCQFYNASHRLEYYAADSGVMRADFYCSWTPSVDTWYHIAIVRNGNTPLIFINGVSQSVTEATTISGKTLSNLSAVLTVGGSCNPGYPRYLNGWIDEYRVSKGIARWAINFTPPTEEYSEENPSKTQSLFPTVSIDPTLQTDRVSGDTITSESYDVIEDALFELETKVGVDSSAVTGSIDYKISNYPTAGVKSRIVQVVNTMYSTVANGTTLTPLDDTIPTIAEGTEFMSQAITPTNVNNKLLIEVVVSLSQNNATARAATMALHQDGGAAIAVVTTSMTQYTMVIETLRHYMTAGTTSSTTFTVRIGGNDTTTITLNGQAGNQFFGGVAASSITITEIGA